MKKIKIMVSEKPDVFFAGVESAIQIRDGLLVPALKSSPNKKVELDFSNVNGTSQSWMNVFLMGALLESNVDDIKRIEFSHCNDLVKELILFAAQKAKEQSQNKVA